MKRITEVRGKCNLKRKKPSLPVFDGQILKKKYSGNKFEILKIYELEFMLYKKRIKIFLILYGK